MCTEGGLRSPVGGAVLYAAPTLPPWEDPGRGPGASKLVTLSVPPAFQLLHHLLQPPGLRAWVGFRLGRDQTVVVAMVIVPEDLVLSLVADAELHPFEGLPHRLR